MGSLYIQIFGLKSHQVNITVKIVIWLEATTVFYNCTANLRYDDNIQTLDEMTKVLHHCIAHSRLFSEKVYFVAQARDLLY